MAGGDAHLRASLVLDTNLEEAVRKASEGLKNVEGVVAKSQDRLKKIIEKGDPLYALKKQQEREIAEVEKHAAKDARLRELAELSKAQIVEKYAKRRQQVEETVAKSIERAQMAARDSVGKLEQKFNAARGVMDALGASSTTAIGQVTAGLADAAQGFAAGGAAGLALTGFTTLVYKLGSAWTEAAERTRQAKIAAATNWQDANAAVRAAIETARGDVLRRRDRLAGVSDETLRGQELTASADEQVGAMASNKAAVERQLAELDKEIEKATKRAAGARESDAIAGGIRLGRLNDQRTALAQHLEEANFQLKEARANADYARIAAEQLVSVLNDEKLADAAKKTKAPKDLELGGGLPNVYAALSGGLYDSLPGSSLGSAEDLLNQGLGKQQAGIDAERDAALERARKDARGMQKAQAASTAQTLKANTDAAQRAEEQWASAGISAAGQFAGAFKSFLDSKDPKDLFGGLLRAAGGIVSMIPGIGGIVGGGSLSILGGFFEQGGVPYAHHLPQGRNGLAVMPGLNFDAKPAWLHPEEVVMPRDVVNDDFGGLPNAMRVAAGHGLPGGAGSVTIVQQNMAFDTPSLDRVWGRAEGVQKQRFTNRQGGAMQSALRSAVLTPRSA